MSNLYKSGSNELPNIKKRIINSNDLLAKKLEEAKRNEEIRLQAERASMIESKDTDNENEDGGEKSFVEGLMVEEIDPESLDSIGEKTVLEGESEEIEETEEVVQEVIKTPEEIEKEARDLAEQILSEARNEAESLKEEARAQGFAEGKKNAEAEINAEKERLAKESEELKSSLDEEKRKALEQLEPQLLDVMIKVFNRVFHIQFDDKKDILEYLIINTIMNVEGAKEFRIKTSEDNFQYISSHLREIKSQVGQEYTLEVIADSSMGENKCMIETDSGYFDCSLGIHLESLTKDLKSLCVND